MRNHVFEQTEKYRDLAAAHAEDLRKYAQLGYNTAHDQLSSLLSKFVLSEVFVLKLMLISFGVLIGTAFSDFFKEHRGFVIFAFVASVALFVYKTIQLVDSWADDDADF